MSEFWPAYDEIQIQKFLDQTTGEPQPLKPVNSTAALAAKAKINKFLVMVSSFEHAQYPCAEAYVAFEKERLNTLTMVIHATDLSVTTLLNDQLFGALGDMQQPQALGYLKKHLEALEPQSRAVAGARTMLLRLWEETASSEVITQQFKLIDTYRLKLRPLLDRKFGFVSELVTAHPAPALLSSVAVRDLLIQAIPQILPAVGSRWTAIVQVGAPNVFIDYERRAVVIPADRSYKKDHIVTLIVHEIGVHVLRSVNGENSKERLAAYGLSGYGPAEEAFGVLLGNASRQTYPQINSLIPFAVIDFATRAAPSTFRKVHELTAALLICLDNPNEEHYVANSQQYQRTAFSRVNRSLRLGTTELVERSTTKYWRGLLLLCRYFDSRGLTESTVDEFFIGKYDCLVPDQARLIREHTYVPHSAH